MDTLEYKKQEKEILTRCEQQLHELRKKFVKENAKFKKGDFIYNVTGIIKVEKIDYSVFRDTIEIVYSGYRYRKCKGMLYRTKYKKISELRYNLKLVTGFFDIVF